MTLGQKQRLFSKMVAELILWAYGEGFELTFGEAYRTPEQAALNAAKGLGIKRSLHCDRLAIDRSGCFGRLWAGVGADGSKPQMATITHSHTEVGNDC
jgi:hypothetical protein